MESQLKNNNDILAQEMQKAQNGDKAAYERLFKSITPIIRNFIHKYLGTNPDCEDVVQEILLAIHRSSHTFNTNRSFRNWMFAIASYKLKDYLRALYRKKELKQVDFASVEDFLITDVTKPTSENEVLNELLYDLPKKQQKIVRMMKIEGYSVKEVAKAMEMSISSVKVAAHRAYKILLNKNKAE